MHYSIQQTRSNIVTGILTRLPVGQTNNCCSNLGRSERFFSFKDPRLTQGSTHPSIQLVPVSLRSGNEIDSSPSSSVEVKSEWSHTSTIGMADRGRRFTLHDIMLHTPRYLTPMTDVFVSIA
jgi:hypothetical protein